MFTKILRAEPYIGFALSAFIPQWSRIEFQTMQMLGVANRPLSTSISALRNDFHQVRPYRDQQGARTHANLPERGRLGYAS